MFRYPLVTQVHPHIGGGRPITANHQERIVRVEAFAQKAEAAFASYREMAAREAGVLVSLDGPNTFPQLAFRTDGPYLVWLGIVMLRTTSLTADPAMES